MNTETRELNDSELDRVAGAMSDGRPPSDPPLVALGKQIIHDVMVSLDPLCCQH